MFLSSYRNTKGTREKQEISREYEHEVRVFPRNFEFFSRSPGFSINSIETRKCFLFPLLNSFLKTKKVSALISITFIQISSNFYFVRAKMIKNSAKIQLFLTINLQKLKLTLVTCPFRDKV